MEARFGDPALCRGAADSQVAHHVVDVGPAARRDHPHAAVAGAELPAERPQGFVEPHGVEKRGVEGDLAKPQPLAFGGVGDSEAREKLVAPHSEVIGGVLLLGERVARLAEGRDVGERVGPPGVGQRAVEIEQKKADFRIFHFSVCYSVEGVYRL